MPQSTVRKLALEILLIVIPLASFFCFWNLGQGSFGMGDETIHACVVQEMTRTGNFVHPTLGDRVYYNKPPLKMWLSAGIVTLFGQTNFNYRVVDGICGVLIVIIVFWFSYSLYRQRLVSYLSILFLLGAQLFYFRHGVRYAVQDAPSLLSLTVALVAAWYSLFSDEEFALNNRGRASVIGCAAIGLGSMCKGLAAFIAYPIILVALAFSNKLQSTIQSRWRALCLILLGSCIPLALFILAQGSKALFCLKTLLWGEGVKRAVEGYQNTNQPLYYLRLIFEHNLTVPAAIVPIALSFLAYKLIKTRDARAALILSWATVPVILHSLMRSRLPWYIMPAIPGLSIAGGVFVGSLARSTFTDFPKFRLLATQKRLGALVKSAAVIISLALVVYNLGQVVVRVIAPSNRTIHNHALDDIKEYQSTTGQKLSVAFHDNYPLTRNEYFYWQMLRPASPIRGKIANLNARLNDSSIDFLVTHPRHAPEVIKHRLPESYLLADVNGKKPGRVLILNYRADLLPYGFTPTSQLIEFGAPSTRLLFGWGETVRLANMVAKESIGPQSALLVHLVGLEQSTGLKATIRLGLLQSTPDLKIKILVNNVPVKVLSGLRGLPKSYDFDIPARALVAGDNLFSFEYSDAHQADLSKPLVLWGRMSLTVVQNPPIN